MEWLVVSVILGFPVMFIAGVFHGEYLERKRTIELADSDIPFHHDGKKFLFIFSKGVDKEQKVE